MKDYEVTDVLDLLRDYNHELKQHKVSLENKMREMKFELDNLTYEMQCGEKRLKQLMEKFCDCVNFDDEDIEKPVLPEPISIDDNENSVIDPPKPCYIYFIESKELSQVKIGISDYPENRLKTLSTAHGSELILLHTVKCPCRSDALWGESYLHNYYSDYHKNPFKGRGHASGSEWFDNRCKEGNPYFGLKPISYFDSFEKIKGVDSDMRELMHRERDKVNIVY